MKQKITFFAFAGRWVLPDARDTANPKSSASRVDKASAPKPLEVLLNHSRRVMDRCPINRLAYIDKLRGVKDRMGSVLPDGDRLHHILERLIALSPILVQGAEIMNGLDPASEFLRLRVPPKAL